MLERVFIEVDDRANKMRLDDFLFERIPTLSRMYLRELIKNEKCEVNGAFENAGRKLKLNDFIEIELDATRGTAMQPESMTIDVVYEDDEIMVVNKAAGILVHPTHRDRNGTLLNGLAFYLNQKNEVGSSITRPGLVHRLDKQTSGLLVVAKTIRAHRVLASHFKKKLVEKKYSARVGGVLLDGDGIIEAPIGRYADLKLWDVKDDGKYAGTRFWVRERDADSTLLELEPVTGRTNQLRIHCAWIGHPIIGDTERGGRPFKRLCLHARRLSFKHPTAGTQMEFETEIPADFA